MWATVASQMALSLIRFDMRAPGFDAAARQELYASALEMAAHADEHGFDSIVLSEHHGTADGHEGVRIA